MEKYGLNMIVPRQILLRRLSELRAAIRRVLALEGLSAVAVAALAGIAFTFALDWSLRLNVAQRILVSGAALACVAVVAWRRLAKPLSRALPDEEIALVLEKYFPKLEDRVITTVQLALNPHAEYSEQLVAAVVQQADEAAQQINPATALDTLRLKRWLAAGCGALATVALAWAVFPATMTIWFQRDVLLRDVPWPQATYLTVKDFGDSPKRVMRGGSLDIIVTASGKRIPDMVRLEMQFASAGRFREELSRAADGKFTRRLDGVVEPFRFWASGGDATTAVFAVELVEPPVLSDVKFRALYPEYTGLAAKTFGLGEGNLEVPAGTTLELSAVSSKPLTGGRAFLGENQIGAINLLSEKNRITTRLKVEKSARLRIALDDAEGFTSDAAFSYPIFALPDRAPTLRLAVTGVGERVTKVATVPLQIEARDDYGVTALELRYGKTDLTGQTQTQPFKSVAFPNRLVRLNDHLWPIEPVGMTEGELIQFRIEAKDAASFPVGGNRAESTIYALRIVSAVELLEELQRRQKAHRIEFERLTNRQREVLDATKLLLDQAAAGQSLSPYASGAGSPAAITADERDIGNGSANIGEQFNRILTEMRLNRVSTDSDYTRLEFRIVGPLRDVSGALLTEIAPAMERINVADPPAALLPKLEAQVELQTRVHEQMLAILTDMVKGETLADAIALLRQILDQQKDLSAAAKKKLEDEINKLLGGQPK